MEQIDSDCQRLDVLANKEPVTRRQNAKIRVDQLKQDVRHLQVALRYYFGIRGVNLVP